MRSTFLFCLCISMSVTLAAERAPSNSARIREGYGTFPLAFEANLGQSDPQVKFLSRGAGYSLFLTSNEAVLALRGSAPSESGTESRNSGDRLVNGQRVSAMRRNTFAGQRSSASAVLRMKLVGANDKAVVSGQDELPGVSNYFIGNDPKKWRTNVHEFAKVRYANVYPGVDLVYYGNQRELEYDFVLQPGADPTQIRLGIEGAKRLRLSQGDLVLTSAGGNIHLRRPHIYQEANGVKFEISGRYEIKNKNEVGFEVAAYDRQRSLVIDPVLAYSTYLGGSGCCNKVLGDNGEGIAVDSGGNAYVTGVTFSTDFPRVNAIQGGYGGNGDAFVAKINPSGTSLVYSTYLGGSQDDGGYGIAVDSGGNAYLTGETYSTDFPTVNAIQSAYGGNGDAFVAKINARGNGLVYSTYLGGSELEWGGRSVAVDSARNAYVTGVTYSSDFPTVKALQPTFGGGQYDAFVTKINAAGSAVVYSTYLGGSGQDWGYGIAADTAGTAYVTGWTNSTDFPTAKALQSALAGSTDAFVTKINASGSAFVYSTYLGGSGDDGGNGIAADLSGNAYVTGYAFSTDFPLVNAVEPVCCPGAFVTKFKADGSAFIYSTYLNSFPNTYSQGSAIAVDRAGNAYITGYTTGGFTTANAIQPKPGGGNEAFVTKLNADDSAFVYSTYLGGKYSDYGQGIAVDAADSAYVVGETFSLNFPTTPVGFELSLKGSTDAFVTKIAQQTFVSVSPATASLGRQVIGTTSAAKKITVTNQGSSNLTINKIYIGGLNESEFAQTNTCGATLAPSANCTVSVTFTPLMKNTRRAGLGINSSDPASPTAIALSGIGTVVFLSTKTLTFGNQQVGTTSTPQSVTLTNTGSAQLNISGINIVGTNAGDFSKTTTCGSSLGAEANCTIAVTFRPTATGTRKAAVRISDDGGGSPQEITLRGTGT